MIGNDSQLRRLARLIEIKQQASKLLTPYICLVTAQEENHVPETGTVAEKTTDYGEADLPKTIVPPKQQRIKILSPVRLRYLLEKPSASVRKDEEVNTASNRKHHHEESRFSTISHVPRHIRFQRTRKEPVPLNSCRQRYRSILCQSHAAREGERSRKESIAEPAIEFEVVQDCIRSTVMDIKRRRINESMPRAVKYPETLPSEVFQSVKTTQEIEPSQPRAVFRKSKLAVSSKLNRSQMKRKLWEEPRPFDFTIDGWSKEQDLLEDCVNVAL